LLPALCATTLAAPASTPTTQPAITKVQADKIIDEAGKTPPPWWDATPLNVPPGLDLSWKNPGGGWNNKKVMGCYVWDIIDPNPGKWKEGAKLLHHSYTFNKADPDAQKKSVRAMAKHYSELMGDPARGAFWAKKSGEMPLTLADCYMKLGCKSAATEILRSLGGDQTRHGQVIKLWADCGELPTALALAERRAAAGDPVVAYLAAGDACRRFGKTAEAIKFYEKVLAAKPANKDRDYPINIKRATANLAAVKLFDALDLNKIPDGTYAASSIGYAGDLEMVVTVKNKKIDNLKVGKHKEKQFYASFDEVPPQIVKKQSVKGIDTTTGATVTSEAIINATAKALSKAQTP
jgi:uncharacterized protein with FMN-binding domain